MAKRSALKFIQYLWPGLATIAVGQTIAVTWAGGPERVAAWIQYLPMVLTIIGILATAAGAAPLVADQIKAKAGILGQDGK